MIWPYVISAWVLVAFVIPYFSLPFMRREQLPTRFPRELEDACAQLGKQHEIPIEYIRNTVLYVLSQNNSRRFVGTLRWREAFEDDVSVLMSRRGFMHEHHLNHLVRIVLSKAPFFSDADIRLRYTFLNFRLHQYLQVHVAGQWYDVDVAGYWWGVPLGSHMRGLR